MRFRYFAALLMLCSLVAQLHADTPSIRGRIIDPSGLPLPGVTVTLRSAAGEQTSTTTDIEGEFTFEAIPPGRYDLQASMDAFETASRRDVDVSLVPVTLDLQLALAAVQQEVTVSAPSAVNVLGRPQPNAPVSVTREVMDIAMLPNSQYDDVLPLMPNVVRGPDGLIAVAGARAASGGLFVNGFNASDPMAGGAGVMLPLATVDTMQVFAGGAPAEFGHASGGITSVQTRSGADQFHMTLDSFFPRLLYTDGVSGVAFWDPNLGFGGPIAKGRVSYQQGLSYRYDRNTYTTLAGPDQSTFNALLSWTQLDARLTDTQRLRVSVSADPRNTDRANVTAFTPSSAAPRLEQGGWSAGVSDSITARGVLVELRASTLWTQAAVTPHGTTEYVMSHQLADGSYFDLQDRRATRIEAGGRVTWSPTRRQVATVGATVDRSSLDQRVQGSDITMLRSNGDVARTISFLPGAQAHVASTTLGLFAQDKWSARSWLTLAAGMRYDETTTAGEMPLSPRAGWTIGRDGDRTTFSGSVGFFSDALPLSALSFVSLPARRIVIVDPEGLSSSTSTVANVLSPDLHVPQAVRWDLEMNRRLGAWQARVRYQERHGTHELVVAPSPSSADGDATRLAASALVSSGASRSRSLETTAGVRTSGGNELYVSYVRSAAYGPQNSLEAVEGLMRVPFVQANLPGPLPIDVPHRILAWGVFHLPANFSVAPFLDTRSGFPFTAIDDAWVMAGTPNMYRLPWTASLDLSATEIVPLPRHLPEARVGLKLYNIVSANTEREVQRDIARTDFGTRYDPVPRDFSIVFEFLWGRHHHA